MRAPESKPPPDGSPGVFGSQGVFQASHRGCRWHVPHRAARVSKRLMATRSILLTVALVVCQLACGSTAAGGGGGSGGSGGAGGGGGGGVVCVGTPSVATKHETPPEHRVTAAACAPSVNAPPAPDGGLAPCTADADCANGAWGYVTCVGGRCSYDQCLSDADCDGGACGCSSDYYGGLTSYHPNLCVPAGCHTDSDCGAGGFCSPTRGYCGRFQRFDCHTAQDTCVNWDTDCNGCGASCVFDPNVGAFGCAGMFCGG